MIRPLKIDIDCDQDDLPTAQAHADGDGPGWSATDFYAYMPTHQYICAASKEFWPAASVNSKVPPIDGLSASAWLDRHRSVEQMTWAPGEALLIRDRLLADGGWIDRAGWACFNLYRPPETKAGNSAAATKWIEHVQRVYPVEHEHIIAWLAHRAQKPHEKINHALVLGGSQGIGKDTILEPVKYAIGSWNFAEVSPQQLLGRFNGFVKCVILRVSEARDLGDFDRFSFYDHMKTYAAAPPDVLRVDEKHRQEYSALNVCGVIITSNHKSDGIYLPSDDRRHFVAWSDLNRDEFGPGYWADLYEWYSRSGYRDVAAYLRGLDISHFDAKAPPPKTAAFWSIVDANRAPEDAELADALDKLGAPAAVTVDALATNASQEFAFWLRDRRNSRKIPHRLESCGYERVRNDSANDGLWKLPHGRATIYAKRELSIRDRIAAAERLIVTAHQMKLSVVEMAWHTQYGAVDR